MRRTGWQVVAVPGLVPPEVFFEHLANRRFPAGQFIRRPDQLDYIEEPDVFHDVFGHVPMLMHPVLADYLQAYGKGGLRAQRLGALDQLSRVYWFTVEFGLVAQDDGLRIYGAGIVSSFAETRFALEDPSPNRLRFDLAARDADALPDRRFPGELFRPRRARRFAAPRRNRFRAALRRGQGDGGNRAGRGSCPSDRVIARGTGAYHAGKRHAA